MVISIPEAATLKIRENKAIWKLLIVNGKYVEVRGSLLIPSLVDLMLENRVLTDIIKKKLKPAGKRQLTACRTEEAITRVLN